ncbi:MAG: zinc-ribbon domain-containing protein [Butyrivibrio sp.]|nr:zinc-ribbon domain-containing protein [Butyrivibrio sp.]
MNCNTCGAQIPEGSQVCPNCGNPVTPVVNATPVQQTPVNNGQPMGAPVDGSAFNYVPQQEPLGMKWANFLGYFVLWIGALINLFAGVGFLTGTVYNTAGVTAEDVYSYFSGLKAIDTIAGVLTLGTAVVGVMAAISIIKRKANAGKLVCALYALNFALSLIYALLVTVMTSIPGFSSSTIIQLIVSVVMFFVNRYYFNNRSDVFVN